MKKISAILGAAAAVLLVAGCASTGSAPKASGGESASVPCINNPEPKGDVMVLDSFEEGNYWQAVGDTWDQWGSHNLSLEADVVDDWASDGDYCAKWTFDIATKETSCQASSFCNALLETDWTDVKYLVLDAKVITDEPITLKANTQNGVDWNWSSTDTVTLGIGENKNVTFDFTKHGISHAEQIACAIIDVTGENNGGDILIDNIRIVR